MTVALDAILALVASARGMRPYSLDDVEVENVLNIALATLVELSVSNDRIDRLERMVAELQGADVSNLREIGYSGVAANERQAAMDALLARALRILIDPREPTDGRPAGR